MNTPRYRIGNDITVFWAINNRDGSPYDLTGKEVRLFVSNDRGREEVDVIITKLSDGTINNVVRWDFKGRQQKILGDYSLTVKVLESITRREINKDYSEAFTLVSRSENEVEEGDANVSTDGDLILSSRLDIYRLEMTNADISDLKENLSDVHHSIGEVTSSLVDINKALTGIGEESIQIKTTINGIQSQVNDIGTEMVNKASVESVIEIGESVKEVQTNYAEQSIKVDALGAEIASKASAESVTEITDALTITNTTLAEQVLRVDDVTAIIETKAEASMVTEIADALTVTNEALASQQMTVDAMSAEIKTKAEASSVAELGESLTATNESLAEQIIKAENLSAEISNKASVESVTAIGDNLSAVTNSLAEQTLRVEALETEIITKASTETVTQIGENLTLANKTLAEQVIKTDELGASIENLVSKETFLTTTGEFTSELTSVKQTQQEISTTIQSQEGEITSIKENINGISLGVGRVEEELGSIKDQIDGVTESYFYDYVPTNENEPALSWINEGTESSHKGDTFTNTALEGDDAGKSWRWLQDESGAWSWHPIADTDAQKALLLASQAQAAADGKVTIYYELPHDYKVGDIWFVHSNEFYPYEKGELLSATVDSSLFDLSHWESKTRYSNALKSLNEYVDTAFRDGVITSAEKNTIISSLGNLQKDKSAIDTKYALLISNAYFTDADLKEELSAAKSEFDTAYEALIGVVNSIVNAETEEELDGLLQDYLDASETYTEKYSAYVSKEEEVSEALMLNLNPANIYIDNITNDGVLTPIEKEQLFEIYRNIAKEHSTTKGNAFNYKIWQYGTDGETEIAGVNGGDGRFLKYVLFTNAYAPIVEIFNDGSWGFNKMGDTTELESDKTVSLLKSRIDEYYTARGELLETFSAITAAIEEAQKNAEKTLADLTGILTPEEMYTQIGKGVVLSTIIATRDTEGNITAGMNASPSFSDDSGENHGRVVFVGGVKDIDNINDATYVVYEDGHVKMSSAEISEYASINALRLGLDEKTDVSDFEGLVEVVNNTIQTLAKMWKIEDGELVTSYPLRVHGNITADKEVAAGGVGEEHTSGEGIDEEQLEDYLKEHEYVTKDEVADLIPDVDLSDYATTTEVEEVKTQVRNLDTELRGVIDDVVDNVELELDKKASKEEVENALTDKATKAEVQAVDEKLDKAVEDLEKADKDNADNIEDLAGKLNDMFYLKDGTIGTKYNFYSKGEISAGGVGTESEGGGGEGSTTLDGLMDVEITGENDFPNTDEGRYQKQSQVLGYNSQEGIWVNKVTMYHHKQTQPSAEWNIKHDLGKFPNVKIVDTLKQLCLGDVYYIDENNVTIKFGGAESGDAYLD